MRVGWYSHRTILCCTSVGNINNNNKKKHRNNSLLLLIILQYRMTICFCFIFYGRHIGHYVQHWVYPMNSGRSWKILQIRLRPSHQFSMLRFYFEFQYRHPSERNTFHKQHLALNKTLTLECHPGNILKLSVYSIRYANAHCPATIFKLTFNYGTEHNESQLQNSP